MNDNRSLADRFAEVDYFTQRQIINEFPTVFPEYHGVREITDNSALEIYPIRKFDMNAFYGAFLIVFSIIGVIGYFMG
jgi:hypothetical protein